MMLSVITVVFNNIQGIELTIKSVLSQRSDLIEYIVIDGGSTDGTTDVIRRYESKIQHWVSESDNGIYDAMNKGIRLASGKWILFMNAGDQFYDTSTIEKLMPYLQASNEKAIVYGDALITDGNRQWIQRQQNRHLHLERSIIHQSMVVQRQHLQASAYNTAYRVMADYDNLLAVSVSDPHRLMYVPQCICIYDKTGVSSRPLYTYFREYYLIAFKRMPLLKFISFNLYILPRLVWSLRHIVFS